MPLQESPRFFYSCIKTCASCVKKRLHRMQYCPTACACVRVCVCEIMGGARVSRTQFAAAVDRRRGSEQEGRSPARHFPGLARRVEVFLGSLPLSSSRVAPAAEVDPAKPKTTPANVQAATAAAVAAAPVASSSSPAAEIGSGGSETKHFASGAKEESPPPPPPPPSALLTVERKALVSVVFLAASIVLPELHHSVPRHGTEAQGEAQGADLTVRVRARGLPVGAGLGSSGSEVRAS